MKQNEQVCLGFPACRTPNGPVHLFEYSNQMPIDYDIHQLVIICVKPLFCNNLTHFLIPFIADLLRDTNCHI